MNLRPYQVAGIDANRRAIAAGHRAIVNVSPTDNGKTVLGAAIVSGAVSKQRKVLWLAHRRELVDQAAATLEHHGVAVGIISASASVMPKPWEPVQVASIQTLQARGVWPDADVVVLDECFPAGTRVDGRAIESVRPGDYVDTVNHATGAMVRRRVVRVFSRVYDKAIVRLQHGATELSCTEDHPIFVKGSGYVKASQIRVGDVLCVRRRVLAWSRVDRIESVKRTGVERTVVYNLETEGTHTYFANGILVHNCHHASADTFAESLKRYANAVRIGLTAIPQRGDGRSLGPPLFSHLIEIARVSDLTRDGYLVPCDVIAPSAPLKPGQIAQRPVDAYLKHTPGQSCLVFAPTLKLASEYAQTFTDAGVSAAMVEGTTDARTRANALAEFKSGELRVLVNVGILTEGTDLPRCSVVILARGCGTLGLYMQIVGRALRPFAGKQRATVIDLRGVSHEHGHPTEDREYSLDGTGIRSRDKGTEQSYCRVCGAPIMPGTGCDECGIGARVGKPVRVTGDALVPYAAARKQPVEARAANWLRWRAEGVAKNFKPGWARAKYRAVYGVDPPRSAAQL